VILFELLVGKLSFGTIQFSLLPKDLQTVVKKALAPNLEDRYQDVVDFITAITTYLKGHPKDSTSHKGVKEVWGHLEESHLKLLPKEIPKWNTFDIGMAKPDKESDLSSYYDFLKFADQSYFIAMAEYMEPSVQGLSYTGVLKGMIQSLTREFLTSSVLHFEPMVFITALNEMLALEKGTGHFLFQLLYLTPNDNRFSFISCGYGSLLHLGIGQKTPHLLANQNPPLGENPHHDFYETTENWTEGDLLVAHTFKTEGEKFENALVDIVGEKFCLRMNCLREIPWINSMAI